VNWRELLGVRQELGKGGERRLVKKKVIVQHDQTTAPVQFYYTKNISNLNFSINIYPSSNK